MKSMKKKKVKRIIIPNLEIKKEEIKKEEIKNPRKRKKDLKREIIITEKYKRKVNSIVAELKKKLNSKKITKEEYKKKLSDSLNTQSPRDWERYYTEYIKYYKDEIKRCDLLIKEKQTKISKNQKKPKGLFKRLLGIKEKEKVQSKLEIETIKALERLKIKRFDTESIVRFNKILRVFLKEKYKLKRSLTIQEIKETLKFKKVRKKRATKIIAILEQISQKEYGKEQITSEELKKLILDAKNLISIL